MGRNKLKDVFSMEPPQPEIEVVFRDAEAQKEFEEAMYRAWENGAPENVEGIKGVIAYDSSCNRRMPFLFSDSIGRTVQRRASSRDFYAERNGKSLTGVFCFFKKSCISNE